MPFPNPKVDLTAGTDKTAKFNNNIEGNLKMIGTVKWFNENKGFGFIVPEHGGKDIFVHISAIEKAGMRGLNEGQRISYEEISDRGKVSAGNLKAA